jgi:molecular chaperone GrpE (heat shock protein)
MREEQCSRKDRADDEENNHINPDDISQDTHVKSEAETSIDEVPAKASPCERNLPKKNMASASEPKVKQQTQEDDPANPPEDTKSQEEIKPEITEDQVLDIEESNGPPETDKHIMESSRTDSLLYTRLEEIDKSLTSLHQCLDQYLNETCSCNREAFDRLYAEMRQYKDNFMMELRRDILTDVVMLYDSIEKLKAFYQDGQKTAPASDFIDSLEGLRIETEEILERCGVVRMMETMGTLNRETQRPLEVEYTSDPAQDMQVVRQLKQGFMWGDRPFRKAIVAIRRYQKPAVKEDCCDAEKETNSSCGNEQ